MSLLFSNFLAKFLLKPSEGVCFSAKRQVVSWLLYQWWIQELYHMWHKALRNNCSWSYGWIKIWINWPQFIWFQYFVIFLKKKLKWYLKNISYPAFKILWWSPLPTRLTVIKRVNNILLITFSWTDLLFIARSN